MKPSIGRIVHFVYNKEHLAAIVTAIWSDTCINLHVFCGGSRFSTVNIGDHSDSVRVTSANYDEDTTVERSWHWPEKV